MSTPLDELKKGELVNVVCPNGDRFLARVEWSGKDGTEPIAFVAPPGCLMSMTIRWPLEAHRLDIQPDPSSLPTLAQMLAGKRAAS